MTANRIDFISAYCDRWCERCAFTDRCSAFACSAAIAMCGDAAEGIELAVGIPQPAGGEKPETVGQRLLAEMPEPTEEELAEVDRAETARDSRIEEAALQKMAHAYMMQATGWLDDHRSAVAATGDPILVEAIEIVGWDAYFIGAKLHRALHGRDAFQLGEGFDDDPVQNDWNGSAKVALISLERSAHAWRVIADAAGDRRASVLADAAAHLHRTAADEFPNAMAFIRPGFDEIGEER